MGRKKGVAPRITQMRPLVAKIEPIMRPRDNTDDLLDAVQMVHTRHSSIKHPGNKKGSFDPTNPEAYNGNTVVVPPQTG